MWKEEVFRQRAEGTLQGMLAGSVAEWAAEPGLAGNGIGLNSLPVFNVLTPNSWPTYCTFKDL